LLLAARIRNPKEQTFVKRGLADESPVVRRAAVQWIAEEKLSDFRPQVEAILNDPNITADLFLATLAALEMLDGVPPAQFDMTPPGKYVLPLVKDEKRPAAVRALALRLVDPAEPTLDDKLLSGLLQSGEPALKLEVVRTLQQSPVAWSIEPLRRIADDNSANPNLRAEAVVGLGRQTVDGKLSPPVRETLVKVMNGSDWRLQREALRSLRGFAAQDADVRKVIETFEKEKAEGEVKKEAGFALDPSGGSRPPLAEVRAAVLKPVRFEDDPLAGRRGFYHANGAGCFKCHTVDGRGGKIGPDLSTIGRALSREKLLDSILDPSKEVAPQFVSWSMETADGRIHTGMLVHENEGKTVLGDAEGKLTELPTAHIVQRTAQKTSVMPEKLADRMTVQEFRDLLSFLEGLK
jgi:putative heme-binding domain-containing protein